MFPSVLIAGLVAASSVSVSARALPPRATTFGSCGSPAIIFADGLDGRNQPAFEPANEADFNHGSALGIAVITSFICQQLNDKCKASAAQITACNAGAAAAAKATGQAAADAFNAALGVTAGGSTGTVAASTTSAAAVVSTTAAAPASTTTAAASTGALTSSTLTFGKCTDPSVIFGAGLDGRKATEFSFLPHDQTQFAHGSALNPDIIFQFTCDNLVNNCGLKQTDSQVTLCRSAQKTADALGKTGAAADSFNGALGFKTDFAALDTGAAASTTAAPATTTSAAVLLASGTAPATCSGVSTTTVVVTVTSAAGAAETSPAASVTTTTAAAAATTTGVSSSPLTSSTLTFGTCTDPSVIFAAGLDGRKATEFSFQPHDLAQFNHNTALNPDIIFQFTCDNLVNNCGLKQTDSQVTLCRSAQKTADALGHTGAAADSFNAALGFKTNFAALDSVATPAAGKRQLDRRGRADPRRALKEMTAAAKKRAFSPAKNLK